MLKNDKVDYGYLNEGIKSYLNEMDLRKKEGEIFT